MANVEIYTTPMCPYCWRAKRLLESKGVSFTEVDLWQEPGRRAEMIGRAGGRRTVPQVFIDGRGVGGSDDIHALDSGGELDRLLAAAAPASPPRGRPRPAARLRRDR
jgi:glutaredoxin 3